MFAKAERGSQLKLIDFGSGTFCATSLEGSNANKAIQYDLNNPVAPGLEEEEKEHVGYFTLFNQLLPESLIP